MVRQPDATRQPPPQDDQLLSKHHVLSFKPQLRLEWRGHDGQNETEQPDHSPSLGDSVTSSTRIRFSVHTAGRWTWTRHLPFAFRPLSGPTGDCSPSSQSCSSAKASHAASILLNRLYAGSPFAASAICVQFSAFCR